MVRKKGGPNRALIRPKKLFCQLAALLVIIATLTPAATQNSSNSINDTIFDDLVNQFMERHKESLGLQQEVQALNQASTKNPVADSPSAKLVNEDILKQHSPPISKRMMKEADVVKNVGYSGPQDLGAYHLSSSTMPHVIALTADQSIATTLSDGDEVQFEAVQIDGRPHSGNMIGPLNHSGDSDEHYDDDDRDKYIQYDNPTNVHETLANSPSKPANPNQHVNNGSLGLQVMHTFQGEVERSNESMVLSGEPMTLSPVETAPLESAGTSNTELDSAPNSTGNTSIRSNNVQARSMYSLNGGLAGILHHSKAPYAASYYSDRATGETTPRKLGELNSRHLDPAFSETSTASTIANSIGRISSHLAASDAGSGNSTTTSSSTWPPLETTTMRPPPVQQTTTTTPRPTSTADTMALPESREPESKLSLHKLATSISQMVELNPIPISSQHDQQQQQANRYADNKAFYQQQQPTREPPTQAPIDMATRLSYSSKIAHDFKNGSPDSRQSHQQHFDTPVGPLLASQQQRKTLDMVSHQLQNNDHYQSQHYPHQEMDSQIPYEPAGLPNSSMFAHRNGHYAASLINVTGPINPPLSATEAMESSLGLDPQRAKTLLHQASGFLGISAAAAAMGATALNETNTSGRNTLNRDQYFLPSSSNINAAYEAQQARVYSSPPNPSPMHYVGPPLNVAQRPLSVSPVTLDPIGESLINDSAYRNRYDGGYPSYFLPMVPRSPAQQNTATNEHQGSQASGFRSPVAPPISLSAGGAPESASAGSSTTSPPSSTVPMVSITPPPIVMNSPHTRPPNDVSSTTSQPTNNSTSGGTTNGFITSSVSPTTVAQQQSQTPQGQSTNAAKRVFNLTRVEHISAECSNDLIRTVIIFNGTFKGIIYSSGYVRDPNCLYINGTGKTRYDFSIRLNQCGTLGRQEDHLPSRPNEVRRRDQVMWNTLSIQYNPIIEQEWDEHFRVSCEYGSDFWKTISFSPFNVETNTGSPVVFTVDPPKCQMEILKGHGMVGPRHEAISGPVTVGDPLTLLIHMKSERAGYDILVKNCIAHNGGSQKMQLIDSNGCVVNERFISPFRGTYNDNDLKHVTLYSYLKAFRFTGKPVLYLECEIHMCQSACPPQMCYWRRLSKRSTNDTDEEYPMEEFDSGINQTTTTTTMATSLNDPEVDSVNPLHTGNKSSSRSARMMRNEDNRPTKKKPEENLSDSLSLFQALEVLGDRDVESYSARTSKSNRSPGQEDGDNESLLCYQKVEVFAFLFGTMSALLAAISITIGCCWRAANLSARRAQEQKKLHYMGAIM